MNGLFIIINPVAGNGKALRVWRKVKKELDRKKVSYRSFLTEYPGHAEVLARQVATIQNYHLKTIIGIGGDGTIHELVNGLSSFNNIKIGFISAGKGNDFSRGLQPSAHPVKEIKQIIQKINKPGKQYELGEYHLKGKQSGRYFIHSLKIGFNAEVKKHLEKDFYNNFTAYLSYFTNFIKELYTYQPCSVDVIVNGELISYQDVWLLTLSKTPYLQRENKLTQNAIDHNGDINLTVVQNMKRYQFFLLLFLNAARKQYNSKGADSIICETLTIRSENPFLIEVDGDIVGETPVSVLVKKSSVEFIT